MTIRDKLILMEDIRKKNDTTWKKYAQQTRPGWTWEDRAKKPFMPFNSIGGASILVICVPVLLVLFLVMKA